MTLPPNLNVYISALLFVLGAYTFALYIGLIVWAFRDIRARSRDVLAQIMVTLLVTLFSVPGLLVYLLLRPHSTLSEEYERSLAEEALMQDLEEQRVCLGCQRRVEPDFIICPYCHHQLRLRCVGCGRLLNPDWDVCPYCGLLRDQEEPTEIEGLEAERQVAEAVEQVAAVERAEPVPALSSAAGAMSQGASRDEEVEGGEPTVRQQLVGPLEPAAPAEQAEAWLTVFGVQGDETAEDSTAEQAQGAEWPAGQPAAEAIEQVTAVEQSQSPSLVSATREDESVEDSAGEEIAIVESRADQQEAEPLERAPVGDEEQVASALSAEGDECPEVPTREEAEGSGP